MNPNDVDVMNELTSVDLSTVETNVPVIIDGIYEVTVAELTIRPNKDNSGQVLSMKFALAQPAPARQGDKETQVNPGFPLFHTVSLKRTFKDDGEVKYEPLTQLTNFREAVIGEKAGQFMPLEQYIGRSLAVQTRIQDDPKFGMSARIQKFKKLG